MDARDAIEQRVEDALAAALPEVDLLELTVAGRERLRVVIDHPAGVDHGLCAEVTRVLDEAGLLERYGVEVWSPGPEPPLRTPDHFRRAVGRRVRIRAEDEAGRRSYTGTLVGADERALRMALAEGEVEVPLASVRRANALETAEAA